MYFDEVIVLASSPFSLTMLTASLKSYEYAQIRCAVTREKNQSSVISPGDRFLMLDVDKRVQKERPSSLAQWAYRVIGQPEVCLRVRLRGNNLHILCESRQGLEAKTVVNRFIKALKVQEGRDSFPINLGNPIYQIIIYGRTLGQERPAWIKQIRIKPSSNYNARPSFEGATNESALIVSNESLARSGSPEAIARYLSENLSSLGVSVKVLIQTLPDAPAQKGLTTGQNSFQLQIANSQSGTPGNRRLWVICNSNYSPDASLLAEPVVEQLRSLQLQGFRDAAICSQVSGEASPEWMLRVDLTPKEEMLQDWARWGDVQAIARTLNQALLELGMEVRAVLKDVTLHVFCSILSVRGAAAPDKQRAVSAIAPVLKLLAPQGIQAATLYGVESHHRSPVPEQETPVWIEWLNLPAANVPALAESAFSLAQQGNQDALTFLLQRLLNPDLDRRLATGGIHLKIRRKEDLLHIMSEAPICPPQAQVGPPIARFLRQVAIGQIAGVRIYGRRAGSTTPAWNYGENFVHRRRLVPEATPEFAASDAYLSELVAPTEEPVLRPDLTQEDLKDGFKQTVQATVRTLQGWLCYSHLFVPTLENQELATVPQRSASGSFASSQSVRVAMVWGMLGLLLTLQTDWLIGKLLRSRLEAASVMTTEASPKSVSLPQVSLQKGGSQEGADDFNASGFTKEGETSVIINQATDKSSTMEKVSPATAAMLGAARQAKLARLTSPNPSFNNQLLDEKLALYQQRLLQSGPPDVLIVGSSRALRGVDPIALQDALAAQGYPDVMVFNFAINGATAQVVDLIIRRILTPEQLPKLIIWADGARAFNSGRVDATYNAIATSEGYEHLKAGTFPGLIDGNQGTLRSGKLAPKILSANSTAQLLASFNKWLDHSLGKVSSTFPQRDQLKSQLRDQFIELLKQTNVFEAQTSTDAEKSLLDEVSIDFDGFLPLSVRFNPATYYNQHPRVAGDYDSDYESFKLGGQQDTALEALLQFAQARKIGIVFVNLPLSKDYLDPTRTEYEEQFQQYMRSSSLTRGLIFRDLRSLLLTKPDYFSDPSHLNRYGAYKVSSQIAQDPMIPWSLVISP